MSWNSTLGSPQRWSPRLRSMPPSGMRGPLSGVKRRLDDLDPPANSGPRKSLRLKLFDLKTVGDIINVGYGKKDEVALNSKYTVGEVLKTLASKDISYATNGHKSRNPLPSEGRENKPKKVQKVKQESSEIILNKREAAKLVSARRADDPRIIHIVCSKCKVGFINPKVFETHKCCDVAECVLSNSQEESPSGGKKADDPQKERDEEMHKTTIKTESSRLSRQSLRSLLVSEGLGDGSVPQNDLSLNPSVKSEKGDGTASEPSDESRKPLTTRIEWLPNPIAIRIGYEGSSCMCMVCASCIPSLQILLQHYLPKPPGSLTCKDCQMDFTSDCQRYVHNLKNHQFVCPCCPKRFGSNSDAFYHALKNHKEQRVRIKAHSRHFTRDGQPPIDIAKLQTPTSMVRAHILGTVKTSNHYQPWPVICGKILASTVIPDDDDVKPFKALLALRDYYEAGRSCVLRTKLKCLLCLQDTQSYEALEEHVIKSHTPDTYRQLKEAVGEDRESRAEVSNSISIPVDGNKTISTPFCNQCQKVFQDEKALKRHNVSVHSVSTMYKLALSRRLTESGKCTEKPLTDVEIDVGKVTSLSKREAILGLNGVCPINGRTSSKVETMPVDGLHLLEKGLCKDKEDDIVDVENVDSDDEQLRSTFLRGENGTRNFGEKPNIGVDSHSSASTSEGMATGTTSFKVRDSESIQQERTAGRHVQEEARRRPTVVKSRQIQSKEASWYLPDSLFTMAAHQQSTPTAQVQELDFLINRTLDMWGIGKKGPFDLLQHTSCLRETGGSIAAYLKLQPLITNPPRTPTARRNYESNPKYKIPMGHFNPEFEEMPLFPTLSDIFKRTDGYKHSPLQIMTAKEIKKSVAMDAASKGSKRLRKDFARAVEDCFLSTAAGHVRALSRGHAILQHSYNTQAHSYLSGRICGHINRKLPHRLHSHVNASSRIIHNHQNPYSPGLPPPLKGPMTTLGTGQHTICQQVVTKPVHPAIVTPHSGQINFDSGMFRGKSFLTLNAQGIATLVNIRPMQTTAGSQPNPTGKREDLTDNLANVMLSLNQPTEMDVEKKYPLTVLRVPLSALQQQQYASIPHHPRLPGGAPGLTSHGGSVLPSHHVKLNMNSQSGSIMLPSHDLVHRLAHHLTAQSSSVIPPIPVLIPAPSTGAGLQLLHSQQPPHTAPQGSHLQEQFRTELPKVGPPPLKSMHSLVNLPQPVGYNLVRAPPPVRRMAVPQSAPPPPAYSTVGLSQPPRGPPPEYPIKQANATQNINVDVFKERLMKTVAKVEAAVRGGRKCPSPVDAHSVVPLEMKKSGRDDGSPEERRLTALSRIELLSLEHSYSIQDFSYIIAPKPAATKHRKRRKKRKHRMHIQELQLCWFLNQQIKRRKREKRLKRALVIGTDQLQCFHATRKIKRTVISAQNVSCKATDAVHVQLVSEAVKRGKRVSIRLDTIHRLYKTFATKCVTV